MTLPTVGYAPPEILRDEYEIALAAFEGWLSRSTAHAGRYLFDQTWQQGLDVARVIETIEERLDELEVRVAGVQRFLDTIGGP